VKDNEHFIGDLFWKINKRIRDYSRLLYWRSVIGKIGKGSLIKAGVRVVGNPKRIKIGNNFKVWQNCHFAVENGEIIIGNNGLLGVGTIINASEGSITIGNNVAIAPYVQVFSYSHNFAIGKNIYDHPFISNVIIEDNVFIGAGAIILPGVTIGNGSRIAAGSLVIKSVKENSVVGGIPAKKLYEY
jgi:acetyltransferase-like isoleucine patch superfamily enzyme